MNKHEAFCYAAASRIVDAQEDVCRPGTLRACLSAGLYMGLVAYDLLAESATLGGLEDSVSVEFKLPKLV